MLAGRVAIVTGAARGIGAATAEALAAAGASVLATDMRVDQARSITGTELAVDNGYTAQ